MNEREIPETIQQKIIPMVNELVKYFSKYKQWDSDSIIFSAENINLKNLIDNWEFENFTKIIDWLIATIWSEKWLSLLISDLCNIISISNVSYYDYLAKNEEVTYQTFNIIKSQHIDFLDRSIIHMNKYLVEASETAYFTESKQEWELQYVFLYTSNKDFIDKLSDIWIDTRRYFVYNWAFAILDPILNDYIFADLYWEYEALKSIKDTSPGFLDSLYNQYTENTTKKLANKKWFFNFF